MRLRDQDRYHPARGVYPIDYETWDKAVARLEAEVGMRVIPKRDSWLMWTIAYLTPVGWVLGPSGFLDDWITTVGKRCYWPKDSWGYDDRVDTLEHEGQHVRQWNKYHIGFVLTYLLLPLPIIITGRAYWEFQADCKQMDSLYERIGRVPDGWMNRRIEHYCNSSYFWMFPFRNTVRRLFWEYRDSLQD